MKKIVQFVYVDVTVDSRHFAGEYLPFLIRARMTTLSQSQVRKITVFPPIILSRTVLKTVEIVG